MRRPPRPSRQTPTRSSPTSRPRAWWSRARSRVDALPPLRGPVDLARFLHITLVAASVPLLLRLKLDRLERVLEPRRPRYRPDDVDRLLGYVDAAVRSGRPVVRSGCLTTGVTRYYVLRRAGVDVSLCFGLAPLEDTPVGHCWLMMDGDPYLEARDPRALYHETYRIPSGAG